MGAIVESNNFLVTVDGFQTLSEDKLVLTSAFASGTSSKYSTILPILLDLREVVDSLIDGKSFG